MNGRYKAINGPKNHVENLEDGTSAASKGVKR
jgi:hypothetical protein